VLTEQHRAGRFPQFLTDRRIIECDYGDWTGQHLKALMKESLWPVVQAQPSAVTFPGGESMQAIWARSTRAIRAIDESVTAEHGADAVWLACSHGDVIKSVVADALGMHLDLFQRIVVDPCSVTAIRYTGSRPYVIGLNETAAGLKRLVPHPAKPKRRSRRAAGAVDPTAASASDATIGGGAGGGAV
jgi:probable phosphomutase (TIGR03848 family)